MKRVASGGAVRQTNLASFIVRQTPKTTSSKPVPPPASEVIVVDDDDTPEPQLDTKRPRISSPSPTPDNQDRTVFSIDPDYPPANHLAYHPPPSPSFNHPFTIAPIPDTLRSTLSFNESPKTISKPNLGLDLLYFKRFIDPSCSAELRRYLLSAMPWYRVKYTVRGISINTPRYTTVFGKDSTSTPWTGYDKASPRAIPRILLALMQKGE